jgi:hypothetical protein
MSADLFAEFASDTNTNQGQKPAANVKPTPQPSSDFSFFDSLNTTPRAASNTKAPSLVSQPQLHGFAQANAPTTQKDDNDDDWGDFEGGSSVVDSVPPAKPDAFGFASPSNAQPFQSTSSLTSASQDPFSFSSGFSDQPSAGSWQKAPIQKAKKSTDPSVLFDAEDGLNDDDDDFGEFEGAGANVNVPAPAIGSSALVDLLGDMSVSQSKPSRDGPGVDRALPGAASKDTTKKKSPVGAFRGTAKPKQPTTTTTPKGQANEDSWDTFDDWEASIPAKTPANSSSKRTTKAANSPAAPAPLLHPTTDDPQQGELPPTNVPPPGVLLSLFPSLFSDAQEKLFKPMAAQTLPMRNKLMAEPTTITYLQGYLMLANVAAHIIAGRKLRWKRDQHLSQGMRIGPASSRATSGMKLTGIDKGENLKEEREAADVVRIWKDQIGRLRHVVSGANQIKAGTLGVVPDLQETMPVKALKQSEGGIPARQPCMMCGLKREERVTAADMAIDDSFGEWWIDQVNMHRGEYSSSCPGLLRPRLTITSRMPQLLESTQEHSSGAMRRNPIS